MQGCKQSVRLGRATWFALVAVGLVTSGCMGPAAVRSTRLRYNESMRITNDEQLLTNVVRLRYADSPVFIDLPGITSQFEMALDGNYTGGYGNAYPGLANLGIGALTLRDTPTLSYHPRQGREIAKALLDPLTADLVSVVNAGARLEQFFWMTLNDINDVPNAVHATTLVPRVPDDNSGFLRGVRLLAEIDDRGGAEIGFSSGESAEHSSDPLPAAMVRGRDLVSAAKDGYVFRTQADGRMVLHKRDRDLVLKIRPAFRRSDEMRELARIFRLTPGLSEYKIKSEFEPDVLNGPRPEDENRLPKPLVDHDDKSRDTIYLNLRSILQIMTFLSKGVCVPEEHIRNGIAPTTAGPDGRPYDWTHVMGGNFFIASQKHRPRDAEVSIFYRDYWYYIPRNDVNSRSVLAVLEVLFTLQESSEKAAGPLLTLPTGG